MTIKSHQTYMHLTGFVELAARDFKTCVFFVTLSRQACSAIKDVIKFVAPGRRKIAPPPQRPLWRQLLCGLETRALALQRD